jgi:hypothetical protein
VDVPQNPLAHFGVALKDLDGSKLEAAVKQVHQVVLDRPSDDPNAWRRIFLTCGHVTLGSGTPVSLDISEPGATLHDAATRDVGRIQWFGLDGAARGQRGIRGQIMGMGGLLRFLDRSQEH